MIVDYWKDLGLDFRTAGGYHGECITII